MLTPLSQQIWDSKYRFRSPAGEAENAVAQTFSRVAEAAASTELPDLREHWRTRFFEALQNFEFLPAGRILAGAGTDRDVTLFNCFVMGEIGDDMGSIFAHVREAALTLQQGGGIGHDFSTLRPKGALVRGVGAEASGPVSFMDVWDAMCRTIMSAGARRGAMMGTLRCDHPDIEAFIEAKADPARLRNFNVSVLATDAFMKAVEADAPWPLHFAGGVYRTVNARDLWTKIMRSAYDYAEPGVIFIDRVNALNNLNYCETIRATNPCVPADTWVQTSCGPRQVQDLIGQPFQARVDGGDHASDPRGFFPTGQKQLVRLETAEGYALRLTADHRIKRVVAQTRHRAETEWCVAGSLEPGDLVLLNNHRADPVWAGEYTEGEGYLIGLLMGDGALKTDKAVLSVWRPAEAVNGTGSTGVDGIMTAALQAAKPLPHRSDFAGWQAVRARNEYRLVLGAVKTLAERLGLAPGHKTITPAIERTSSAFYRGFLRGFFDADGSVQGSQQKGVSVRLAQSDVSRLQAVQRMLLRLGIASTMYRERRSETVRSLPDGRGCKADYITKPQHELMISGENILHFRDLIGFADTDKSSRLHVAISNYKRFANRERFLATISKISDDGVEDVYDVSIPGLNAFDANGFWAHNCGEQPLPPYGACLLGSINLAALVEHPFSPEAQLNVARLKALTPVAVRFLDNIIDISNYPLPAQEQEAKAKRRIGLGVTGLADALAMCGAHYGREDGRDLATAWLKEIAEAAYLASADLAREKGAFPLYDAERFQDRPFLQALRSEVGQAIAHHGLRNGLLISIAPTGTISLLAGNVSSGIEPIFDFEYHRRILGADGVAKSEAVQDFAVRLFRERHPSAPLPPAFVTAHALSPRDHLLMQAAVQTYVDASISKTVNCPRDISFEDFQTLYLEAYRLGLKGCTAYRPNDVTGAVLTAHTPAAAEAKPSVATQPALPLAPAPVIGDGDGSMHPMLREPVLTGFTYKIEWPPSDHALYITINDIVEEDRRRPFEIFINSKNLEHYAWTVALTRMISAIFRRGGDVSFVAEELKAVFDPRGGAWMGGAYVPSLLAAIGDVIEGHMRHIGFIPPTEQAGLASDSLSARSTGSCPRCGSQGLTFQEGCLFCRDCGYSSCG